MKKWKLFSFKFLFRFFPEIENNGAIHFEPFRTKTWCNYERINICLTECSRFFLFQECFPALNYSIDYLIWFSINLFSCLISLSRYHSGQSTSFLPGSATSASTTMPKTSSTPRSTATCCSSWTTSTSRTTWRLPTASTRRGSPESWGSWWKVVTFLTSTSTTWCRSWETTPTLATITSSTLTGWSGQIWAWIWWWGWRTAA